MGWFDKKKDGGLADVIRCDEREYLIWKWSPDGDKTNSKRMNSIRYGSRLRVKEGEVAAFVYDLKNGIDFIEGPMDEVLKTANFPVLSSIVGAAFGGNSPFQAEVFFINRAGVINIPFFIRDIELTDPRQDLLMVNATAKGAIVFNIDDYKRFISLHQMADFNMDDLSKRIQSAVIRYVSHAISNAPHTFQIPVIQIGRAIDELSTNIEGRLKGVLDDDFGINLRRLDISEIALDKESDNYKTLQKQGALQSEILNEQMIAAQQNIRDNQRIASVNLEESMRINREETQRRQKLETEGANLTAHQLNVQGEVGLAAAQSLGQLGGSGLGTGGGDGLNPAGMMTGMMLGGAIGQSMSGMMGNMMQGMNQPQPPTPPAAAVANLFIAVNGAQSGPFMLSQVRDKIASGEVVRSTFMWKEGMAGWSAAENIPEVAQLFAPTPPPIPPTPPTPPTPPAL